MTFSATLEADIIWRSLSPRSIRVLRWISRFLESRFGSIVSIGEAGSVINSLRCRRCPFGYFFEVFTLPRVFRADLHGIRGVRTDCVRNPHGLLIPTMAGIHVILVRADSHGSARNSAD